MKGHEVPENLVAEDTRKAVNLAVKSCREQLSYTNKVQIRWFVTERNLAFDSRARNIFQTQSETGFVPVIKHGTPEVWLSAILTPEEAASVLFHEFRHLLDVHEVGRLEQLVKEKNLPPNIEGDWRTYLHDSKRIQSEKDSQKFQEQNAQAAMKIGEIARQKA
ncbi:hypothetical protein L0244_14480 [bacterium]|nr:hypothetical protein [bacterium]